MAAGEFEPGSVAGGEETEPGVLTMPYTVLAPEIRAFLDCLDDASGI